jgi:hypothetical protein
VRFVSCIVGSSSGEMGGHCKQRGSRAAGMGCVLRLHQEVGHLIGRAAVSCRGLAVAVVALAVGPSVVRPSDRHMHRVRPSF